MQLRRYRISNISEGHAPVPLQWMCLYIDISLATLLILVRVSLTNTHFLCQESIEFGNSVPGSFGCIRYCNTIFDKHMHYACFCLLFKPLLFSGDVGALDVMLCPKLHDIVQVSRYSPTNNTIVNMGQLNMELCMRQCHRICYSRVKIDLPFLNNDFNKVNTTVVTRAITLPSSLKTIFA